MKIKKPKTEKIELEVDRNELSAICYAMMELNKEKDDRFYDPEISFFTTGGRNRFNKGDIDHIAKLTENFLDTYR